MRKEGKEKQEGGRRNSQYKYEQNGLILGHERSP
jgi:hypothetical protein